jgi:hypothetical protein
VPRVLFLLREKDFFLPQTGWQVLGEYLTLAVGTRFYSSHSHYLRFPIAFLKGLVGKMFRGLVGSFEYFKRGVAHIRLYPVHLSFGFGNKVPC